MKKLAIFGGEPIFKDGLPQAMYDNIRWPKYTQEDEDAALEVMRNNSYSSIDITEKFESEFAQWIGTEHAVAYANGTMALAAAMFGIGLSKGDEIICPTKTYWASIVPATIFGAVPVFCAVDEMLSIDPDDIERLISPKTKAIMVVHYCGYPADMDRIMAIANKYNLKVIEDVSHAQGGLYKGKRVGTFGDVAAMSLMSTKSFSAGELGIVVTNNRRIYERALAYGHYDRNNSKYIKESEELFDYYHIALGGVKGRANQLCCAIARVQLKYYDERCAKIRETMNYFYDELESITDAFKAVRIDESTGSNMAGFYGVTVRYYPEKLSGLSINTLLEAVNKEIGKDSDFLYIVSGGNYCLHKHNLFKTFDFNNAGSPTALANAERDVRALDEKLIESENRLCFSVPWFKTLDKQLIDPIVTAFRNVVENYKELLAIDNKDADQGGRWHGFTHHNDDEN